MIKKQKSFGDIKPCIICKKTSFTKWAKLENYQARKCNNCGMISVNPTPNQEFLNKYYEGYSKLYTGNSKLDKKSLTLLDQRKLVYQIDKKWITKFIDQGKVLDVGCSGGQFLSHFNSKRWNRFGIDVDEEAVRLAKSKFKINARVGDLFELEFRDKFDLILFRGVIEHFSDPMKALKKCSTILKKNGYLFITATPTCDAFAFDVYREKWKLFTPPEHLHFFSVSLLTKSLKKYGFELIDHHYQYAETPYANPEKDFKKIKNDLILASQNKRNKIKTSNPFPGSMMTAVWKKIV
jgi:2-polyprenyl-3-methyl-5-hydroxy-6-metoxy-1,4-benzoquinol methylase